MTTTRWTDDEVAEKVAKLLAKAESTTPAEAEAVTAKAEELLVRYGVSRALAEAKRAGLGQVVEAITKIVIEFKGIYRQAQLTGSYRVVEALGGLRALDATRVAETRNTATLWVIGRTSDVEGARLLVSSLLLQGATALTAWWRDSELRGQLASMPAYLARREFVQNFGLGAASRVRDRRRLVETEATRDGEPGTALVLRDRLTDVNAWIARELGGTTTTRSRRKHGDGRAASAGYAAGRGADVGDARLGGGRRQLQR